MAIRSASMQIAREGLTSSSSSPALSFCSNVSSVSLALPSRTLRPQKLKSTSRPGCRASSSLLDRPTSAPSDAASQATDGAASEPTPKAQKRFKVLVAGAGIGGLVFALGAKNRGIDVEVFERDLTAIRGEGQYRGPIQVQSNALAALEAVDVAVAEEVMAAGCVTGDRINGLCDGVTGEWYVKFDTFTPAADSGLPVTRVISRMTLQEILVKAVGDDIVRNGVTVLNYKDDGSKVLVELSNGETVEGDMLVGADGIRSRVRELLLGSTKPTYSDYTCYTGICDFTPADIDTVGYRVFLGHKQYFVSSDVGHGKMQWYAFYNEAAGGTDPPNCRKERLLQLFGDWCDDVVELIQATPEQDVLRRDIYDRIPILQWGKGRVTLLGDAAHAMQPNLGQGGCMAIEDGFQLAIDLEKALARVDGNPEKINVPRVLQQYESERRVRVGTIHGMARMAAIMASTYKAYLGEGMGPLSWLTQLRIPHWGRVAGQFVMKLTMPLTLQWVLGGNRFALEGRAPYCRLEDKASKDLNLWLKDDDALERATQAEYYLMPANERMPATGSVTEGGKKLVFVGSDSSHSIVLGSSDQVGSAPAGCIPMAISSPGVEPEHCLVDFGADHAVCATDISTSGTWLVRANGRRQKLQNGVPTRIHPGEGLLFGPQDEVGYRLRMRKPVSDTADKAKEVSVA